VFCSVLPGVPEHPADWRQSRVSQRANARSPIHHRGNRADRPLRAARVMPWSDRSAGSALAVPRPDRASVIAVFIACLSYVHLRSLQWRNLARIILRARWYGQCLIPGAARVAWILIIERPHFSGGNTPMTSPIVFSCGECAALVLSFMDPCPGYDPLCDPCTDQLALGIDPDHFAISES